MTSLRVAVIGAGPSGAIAALVLARGGARVDLFDRSAWPREKTCGDGISPLALEQCRELGIEIPAAVQLRNTFITTPNGRSFAGAFPARTPWGTIVSRRRFDGLLVDAAVAAGAAFFPRTAIDRVQNETNGVAVERGGTSERYDAVVLGEGATGKLAGQLGIGRHRSRLISVRGYTDAPAALAEEYGIFYDRDVTPGYGWVFPVSTGRANAGILIDERVLARQGGDARALLERWLRESRYARERLGERVQLDDVKGGVIPSGRARVAGRVMLAGDAGGVADPFTAEGIYQAIHSGRIAAETLLAHGPAAAGEVYRRATRFFDRNAAAARVVRATFDATIDLCAMRAKQRPGFGDYLSTAVFFPKRGVLPFGIGVVAAAVSA